MTTIDPDSSSVKGTRRYRSETRAAQSQRTRDRVLDSAQRLFVDRGYGSTTMRAVAAEAEVSVETIYKVFATKAGVVRAIRDRALLGAGPVPAEQRSDEARDREEDPVRIVATWAALQTEVMPRVAPILLVVRSAAEVDPELAPLRDELDADRLARMHDNARHLARHGHLRSTLSVTEARDVMFAYSAPELYELLVIRQHWTVARYGEFVRDALTTALLGTERERCGLRG
jgi:AcrR family transcriptional regulator